MLCNLKELYVEFRNKYPHKKFGVAKFCQLRPKWCITVGAAGTHSVCVCMMHQNVKLMLTGISLKTDDYKTLISKTICNNDMESKECMFYRYEACLGKGGI